MSFNFHMPVKFFGGTDAIAKNHEVLGSLGKRCLIVTGASAAKKSGALEDVAAVLAKNGVEWQLFDKIGPNPLLSVCHEAGNHASNFGADFLIGIGGGSPLDATKAAAVFAANPGMQPMELYKGWKNPALPFVLVGTTAGTGSEVTRFSVLTVDSTGQKQSWGNDQSYAKVAFGDPRYTYSLPHNQTVSTALDAVAHALEAYFSESADDVSDMMSVTALKLLIPALDRIHKLDGIIEPEQRAALYEGSIYAGFALNRCGTHFCHLMGYVLSEEYDIPHGYACAVFLPSLIHHAVPLMPAKAQKLFASIGLYAAGMCEIVAMLTEADFEPLSDQKLEQLLDRWAGSGNLRRVPGRFDREKQREIASAVLQKKAWREIK